MEALRDRDECSSEPAAPPRVEASGPGDLLKNLDLPREVSTQEAAAILGCCKHTVLQYREEGLLEWRNTAPRSSTRPVYRFTLRSVLELRLGYQRGDPRPPRPPAEKKRRRPNAGSSTFNPKHVRRKQQEQDDGATKTNS
jgi:hypothetical protein